MITLFYAGALTFLGLILAGRIVSIRLSDQVFWERQITLSYYKQLGLKQT